MSTGTIHVVLLKKELRQFLPLVVGIVVLGLAGFVMIEAQPTYGRINSFSTGYLLLAIPAFFAVGAGAMSVSQEKETRTLGWLSSLPLTQESLINTKFVSAVLIWASLWLLTIGSILFIDFVGFSNPFPGESIDTHPIYTPRLVYWIMHSFYLLVCSFLTAWWFGSSMTGLVAFIPLAIAPSLFRFAIAYVQKPFYQLGSSVYDATLAQLLFSVTVSLAIAFWFMRKYAYQALQPAESNLPRNPYASKAFSSDLNKQSSQSVLDPTTAMLWQFVFQNRTFLFSILAVSGISGLIALVASRTWDDPQRSEVEPFVGLVVALCVSWMGVLAFQGDNLQERIRFLSDRGVKPSKVWLTRLLMPISFAASVALFFALVRNLQESIRPDYTYIPVWTVFVFAVMSIGYSQWVSQLVRNPILGAIGGPVMSWMAGVYLAYGYGFMVTSTLPLVLICVVPFIATYWTMARWMDRRFDRIFWLSHGCFFLLAVLPPVVELAWYVAQFPNMPRAMQTALREEAKSIGALDLSQLNNPQPQGMTLESFTDVEFLGYSDVTVDQRLKLATAIDDSERSLNEFRKKVAEKSSTSGVWVLDTASISARVLSSRIAFLDSNGEQSKLNDYRNNVELLFEIAKALRANRHLRSQEVADLHEIALLVELRQPDAKQRFEPAAYQIFVEFLSDSDARNRARREALVVAWAKFDASDTYNSYHDWLPYTFLDSNSAKQMLTLRPKINHLAKVLLEFLETGPTATEDQKAKFLEARIASPDREDYENRTIVNRVDDPLGHEFPLRNSGVPGDQWFAGWEQVARDLK